MYNIMGSMIYVLTRKRCYTTKCKAKLDDFVDNKIRCHHWNVPCLQYPDKGSLKST